MHSWDENLQQYANICIAEACEAFMMFEHNLIKGGEQVDYIIVISQTEVRYHCYYTRLRAKPEVEC